MRLAHAVETRLQQTQRIDPRQILASEMLSWTTAELEAAIERELAENPALEKREADDLDPVARVDPRAVPADHDLRVGRGVRDNLDDFDPMERLVSSVTLRDHLRQQVGQVASPQISALVRGLIDYIDDRGYLSPEHEDDRRLAEAAPEDLEMAVQAVHAMDPPGVGARSLRECLLLQVAYLDQVGEGDSYAAAVLTRCWDDLVVRRDARIATRLAIPLSRAQETLSFLQHALTPYPGGAFRQSWDNRPSGGSPCVRPDVLFRRDEAGFVVELPGDLSTSVLLAPFWQKLAEQPAAPGDDSMRRYVREHVERAEGFLQGLKRRGRTLRLIAESLVELQQGYLETSERAFLRPLTRATLSERLHLDESVISRAVSDKFAQLPSGEVVPLDAFFGNAHAAREALATLIAEEDPANPYSDDEIADIMTRQGFPLARRTVAKYRGLEKILPARLRKRT